MVKIINPLNSISASGRLGGALRFASNNGRQIVKSNKSGGATAGIRQRRQASIISEAARLWKTAAGRGPENNYQNYFAAVSKENYFFWDDAKLLTWTPETLLTI